MGALRIGGQSLYVEHESVDGPADDLHVQGMLL